MSLDAGQLIEHQTEKLRIITSFEQREACYDVRSVLEAQLIAESISFWPTKIFVSY